MKTIGKITTFIVMLALISAAAINLTIHIKSGEFKTLLQPKTQQEQEKTPEQNPKVPSPEQEVVASWNK